MELAMGYWKWPVVIVPMNKMSQVILAELKSKLIEGLVSESQKNFICF